MTIRVRLFFIEIFNQRSLDIAKRANGLCKDGKADVEDVENGPDKDLQAWWNKQDVKDGKDNKILEYWKQMNAKYLK
jgi:hypothetical protein